MNATATKSFIDNDSAGKGSAGNGAIGTIEQLDLGTAQLSYAAGSTSLDPMGFRKIGGTDQSRFGQLLEVFPSLAGWVSPQCIVINAYPAALGLGGFAPLVDTYLHPPTFIRSMRLAATQDRNVILAAQPLVGADFLLRMLQAGYEIPRQILWASGGYYFPESLQRFITGKLKEQDCDLKVLHCYGAAEVGHSCFAAIDRFDSGHPRYRHVAKQIEPQIDFTTETLVLSHDNRSINTGDHAQQQGANWKLQNASSRLSEVVRRKLESWNESQWERRTGYSGRDIDSDSSRDRNGDKNVPQQCWQLRQSARETDDETELKFYAFWERFGGSFQSKPIWDGLQRSLPGR